MHTLEENKNKILERNYCLSQRELLNYAIGKLSEKEKKKVETHLLECEKCISLYQEVLNKKETADVNGKYADLFPEAPQNKFEINFISKRKFFTIVAVLLGVIVLYGAYSKFSQNSVKNENAYSPISEPEKIKPEPVTNPEAITSPVKEEKIIEALPGDKNKIIAEKNDQNIPKEIKNAEKKGDEIIATKNKPVTIELQKPVEKIINPPATAPVPAASPAMKNQLPVKDSVEKTPSLPVAAFIKNYKISKSPEAAEGYTKALEFIFKQIDHADYKNALSETGKFLNDYPADVNGKYYKGYIYYQMLDNDHAMAEMDWITNKHDKIFYEDARWYKALILNRTQKPDEAKKILNELAVQGTYTVKAKQLLELMGEK